MMFFAGMCAGVSLGFLAGAVWASWWARTITIQIEAFSPCEGLPDNVIPFRRDP